MPACTLLYNAGVCQADKSAYEPGYQYDDDLLNADTRTEYALRVLECTTSRSIM